MIAKTGKCRGPCRWAMMMLVCSSAVFTAAVAESRADSIEADPAATITYGGKPLVTTNPFQTIDFQSTAPFVITVIDDKAAKGSFNIVNTSEVTFTDLEFTFFVSQASGLLCTESKTPPVPPVFNKGIRSLEDACTVSATDSATGLTPGGVTSIMLSGTFSLPPASGAIVEITPSVSEPSSLLILGTGLVGLCWARYAGSGWHSPED